MRLNAPLKEFLTNDDGTVKGLQARPRPHFERDLGRISSTRSRRDLGDTSQMRDGSVVTADAYVSAVPVDIFKRIMPTPWQKIPYFRQCDELEGIPVRIRK